MNIEVTREQLEIIVIALETLNEIDSLDLVRQEAILTGAQEVGMDEEAIQLTRDAQEVTKWELEQVSKLLATLGPLLDSDWFDEKPYWEK